MSNILAAKVLMSHLSEITDGAYKTATEIAIVVLFKDARINWLMIKTGLSLQEYLGLSQEEYERWANK